MKLDWFRGCKSSTDKEEMKQILVISKPVLDKLAEICYNKRQASNDEKIKKPDYTDSAWPIVQADLNGYTRAMTEIINLIESIEE